MTTPPIAAPPIPSTTCPTLKRDGQRCGNPAIKDGLCIRHVPAAIEAGPAAREGSVATRRANRLLRIEEEARRVQPRGPGRPPGKMSLEERARRRGRKQPPEQVANRKAKMAEPERKARHAKNVSRAQFRRKAEDSSVPRWLRWFARQMLDRDMGMGDLAQRFGVKTDSLSATFKRTNIAPAPITVARLELIFGPMPGDIKLEIRRVRSERAGGKTTQRMLKERVKKWPRRRLEQELKKMPGLVDDKGRLLPEWRAALPATYGRVKIAGYDLYKKAQAQQARSGLRVGWQGTRTAGPTTYVRTPDGVLRQILSGLRRRKQSLFYQCQACGVWWARQQHDKRGALCALCWKAYESSRGSWRLGGQNGTEPPLPRRPGGKLISPTEIESRIISLIEFRVSDDPVTYTATAFYRETSRTAQRLEASTHPWFQRVAQLLSQLS